MIASMTRESAAIASFPPSSNATKSLRAMFDSSPVKIHSQVDWELPAAVQEVRKLLRTSAGYPELTVSDVALPHAASTTVSSAEKIVLLTICIPPSLQIGPMFRGCRRFTGGPQPAEC